MAGFRERKNKEWHSQKHSPHIKSYISRLGKKKRQSKIQKAYIKEKGWL